MAGFTPKDVADAPLIGTTKAEEKVIEELGAHCADKIHAKQADALDCLVMVNCIIAKRLGRMEQLLLRQQVGAEKPSAIVGVK